MTTGHYSRPHRMLFEGSFIASQRRWSLFTYQGVMRLTYTANEPTERRFNPHIGLPHVGSCWRIPEEVHVPSRFVPLMQDDHGRWGVLATDDITPLHSAHYELTSIPRRRVDVLPDSRRNFRESLADYMQHQLRSTFSRHAERTYTLQVREEMIARTSNILESFVVQRSAPRGGGISRQDEILIQELSTRAGLERYVDLFLPSFDNTDDHAHAAIYAHAYMAQYNAPPNYQETPMTGRPPVDHIPDRDDVTEETGTFEGRTYQEDLDWIEQRSRASDTQSPEGPQITTMGGLSIGVVRSFRTATDYNPTYGAPADDDNSADDIPRLDDEPTEEAEDEDTSADDIPALIEDQTRQGHASSALLMALETNTMFNAQGDLVQMHHAVHDEMSMTMSTAEEMRAMLGLTDEQAQQIRGQVREVTVLDEVQDFSQDIGESALADVNVTIEPNLPPGIIIGGTLGRLQDAGWKAEGKAKPSYASTPAKPVREVKLQEHLTALRELMYDLQGDAQDLSTSYVTESLAQQMGSLSTGMETTIIAEWMSLHEAYASLRMSLEIGHPRMRMWEPREYDRHLTNEERSAIREEIRRAQMDRDHIMVVPAPIEEVALGRQTWAEARRTASLASQKYRKMSDRLTLLLDFAAKYIHWRNENTPRSLMYLDKAAEHWFTSCLRDSDKRVHHDAKAADVRAADFVRTTLFQHAVDAQRVGLQSTAGFWLINFNPILENLYEDTHWEEEGWTLEALRENPEKFKNPVGPKPPRSVRILPNFFAPGESGSSFVLPHDDWRFYTDASGDLYAHYRQGGYTQWQDAGGTASEHLVGTFKASRPHHNQPVIHFLGQPGEDFLAVRFVAARSTITYR